MHLEDTHMELLALTWIMDALATGKGGEAESTATEEQACWGCRCSIYHVRGKAKRTCVVIFLGMGKVRAAGCWVAL